jgi:uncharacterized protein (DUF983 family)
MAAQQKFSRMLIRAMQLKCPWCGSRRTFVRGWFKRHDRCRTCGIAWHREEGFELGTVTANTIVTFGALAIAMTVGFIVTAPDIPVLPFVLSLFGVALVVPILIYPFTYTMWLAFDLAVHPPERAELDQAASAVDSGDAAAGTPLARSAHRSAQRRKRST